MQHAADVDGHGSCGDDAKRRIRACPGNNGFSFLRVQLRVENADDTVALTLRFCYHEQPRASSLEEMKCHWTYSGENSPAEWGAFL
jgi:hypothetical protein